MFVFIIVFGGDKLLIGKQKQRDMCGDNKRVNTFCFRVPNAFLSLLLVIFNSKPGTIRSRLKIITIRLFSRANRVETCLRGVSQPNNNLFQFSTPIVYIYFSRSSFMYTSKTVLTGLRHPETRARSFWVSCSVCRSLCRRTRKSNFPREQWG